MRLAEEGRLSIRRPAVALGARLIRAPRGSRCASCSATRRGSTRLEHEGCLRRCGRVVDDDSRHPGHRRRHAATAPDAQLGPRRLSEDRQIAKVTVPSGTPAEQRAAVTRFVLSVTPASAPERGTTTRVPGSRSPPRWSRARPVKVGRWRCRTESSPRPASAASSVGQRSTTATRREATAFRRQARRARACDRSLRAAGLGPTSRRHQSVGRETSRTDRLHPSAMMVKQGLSTPVAPLG